MYLYTQFLIKAYFCLLVSCMLLSTNAAGQAEPEPEVIVEAVEDAEELPAVIHFVSIGYIDANLSEGLYYRAGTEYKRLRIVNASRGVSHPFRPREEFTVYRKQQVDGEEVMVPYISRQLPGDSDNYIAFFAQMGNGLGMLVFDDSLKAHPRNTVRFHNLSSHELKGFVNKETVVLAPNETLLLPVDADQFSYLNIDLRAKDAKGIWRPSYQRSSQVIPHMRMNIIAGNRPVSNSERGHVLLTYRLIQHMATEER